MVVSHGLSLYCALLQIRHRMFLFRYYNALCMKARAIRGEFYGFMSLLTYRWCCFKCLWEVPEMQMQTLASVTREFRLTKSELDQLTSFKTLPRMYLMGNPHLNYASRLFLFVKLFLFWLAPRASTPRQHTKSKNLRILLHGIECTPILQQTLAAFFQSPSLYSCRYFTSTSSSTSFHPRPAKLCRLDRYIGRGSSGETSGVREYGLPCL